MKLKSIKGLLPSKNEHNCITPEGEFGFAKAIDQIGEKDLPKMDREKLGILIKDKTSEWCRENVTTTWESYVADALIANQDELFECK